MVRYWLLILHELGDFGHNLEISYSCQEIKAELTAGRRLRFLHEVCSQTSSLKTPALRQSGFKIPGIFQGTGNWRL